MKHRIFWLVLIAFATLAACQTGPQRRPSYEIAAQSNAGETFDRWFDGELDPADLDVPPPAEDEGTKGDEADTPAKSKGAKAAISLDRLFAAAEVYYWHGDVERAFELYGRMLRRAPDHPLQRYAAARLYDLRDAVVDFHERITPTLERVRLGEVDPLTRVYLSLLGQSVRYRAWRTSDSTSPFRIDGAGFPTDWTVAPRLSPWRSIDFDREFPVEEQSQIADTYRSPWFAEKHPVNREHSKPYRAGGLNLSPNFGQRGIYYLETFVTVEPPEREAASSRAFWLYGNFSGAARVWIDGREVLDRQLRRYGTGKRLRRLRLEPGTHRVLVKLAFEPGYRDWFDMAFLGDAATPLAGSGLSFSRTPPGDGGDTASIQIESTQLQPDDLEPTLVSRDGLDGAEATSLYLTALGAYYGQHPDHFELAWRELMDRHDDFAAGHGLRSAQVQTLWEMPSETRNAKSLTQLRRAHELDRDSLHYLTRLAQMLKQRRSGESEEVRNLLEVAKDGAFVDEPDGSEARLENVEPLAAWARLMSERGWDEEAERAWRRTLEVAPSHCEAARRLQDLYYGRSYYPDLETITPEWKECPNLEESLIFERSDRQQAKLAYYRQRASRHPYSVEDQLDYADQLVSQGKRGKALDVLRDARDRMPWASAIWNELAESALTEEGQQAAVDVLNRAIETNGHSQSILSRMSTLTNEIPLRELMLDGKQKAMDHLETGREGAEGAKSSDEAYYVVDYAARQYMPNGTTRTLTHTVVRTMTKGAIDRFGETSVPGNAELLMARTINQDGSVEVPEPRAGKSTLSMPGLDEGDFVELAYVQYGSPSNKANSHREGIRFFFRMSDISSIHSEYVVLGTEEDTSFIRQNDPPEAEDFERAGYEGVRFLREDSPRPRREPYSVGGTEFLPWIQLHDEGVTLETFDVDRRYVADRVMSSLDVSRELRKKVREWRSDTEPGTLEEIRDLFYDVTTWVSNANPTGFGRDAAHVLLSKEGSPYVLLKTTYDIAGIDSDIYLVKSEYEHPDRFPIREFSKYRRVLMRIEAPDGEARWVAPSHRDAMFGAASLSLVGQPAVCVTCDELVRKTVPDSGFRENAREVSVDGDLSAKGVLTGSVEATYHGVRAVNLRSNLRRTPSETRRRKFMGQIMTSLLPGSTLTDYEIARETEPDRPLVLKLEFKHTNFAQSTSSGTWRVQTALFREPVGSAYAKLRKRVRPMMIGRQRETSYDLEIELPDAMEASLESRSGSWSVDSEFGDFSRKVNVADGTLEVRSSLELPIQRVSTEAYPDFQTWAVEVEKSSRLLITLTRR